MSSAVNSSPDNHPWYGIQTRSNQEKLVFTSLNYQGFEPFLPLYRTRKRWSDRVVSAEVPLFPGYVFCRFDHCRRLPVITTPGVVSIVRCGNQLAPIPEEQIKAVRAVVESGLAAEPSPHPREGQRIRVTHGPLQSLEGTMVRRKSDWCLVATVEILRRSVSVEIDPAHVEAL
jgi:transcription antitermination factor NusG